MHIAILVTNTDTSAFASRHPGDADRFSGLLQLVRPDWAFTAIDTVNGALPPEPAVFDGYIVTGSPASANDPDDWIAGLKRFIRQRVAAQVPLFGACFGHQVIASALGGQVEQSAHGWRLGLYEAPGSLALGDDGAPIRLYAAHKDQVTELPPGAVPLGGTADCPLAGYTVGNTVYSSQYHPEMPYEFVTALVEEIVDHVGPKAASYAQSSLAQGRADMERFAQSVAVLFESAQASAASKSIAVT